MARNQTIRVNRSDRVATLHPAGKHGARIERSKYDEMRRVILRCMPRSRGGVLLSDLRERVADAVAPSVFGPRVGITWYLITVKQDLEARGEIELVPGVKPQHLRRPRRTMGP